MELIKDNRLLPRMTRVRSGQTQIFTDPDNGETMKLKHGKKSMYADLIEGKWYWIEGCGECRGEERGIRHTYIECEEHDRCRVCHTNRKDIKDIPWGGTKGWICKPCQDEKDNARREAAFEKLNGEEPDTSYEDEIICPHCGSEQSRDDIHESDPNMDCYVCGGEFSLEVDYTATYSTTIKGKRITS